MLSGSVGESNGASGGMPSGEHEGLFPVDALIAIDGWLLGAFVCGVALVVAVVLDVDVLVEVLTDVDVSSEASAFLSSPPPPATATPAPMINPAARIARTIIQILR